MIFAFGIKLYLLLIIKNLSPEYSLCANSIYHFIYNFFELITYLIGDSTFNLHKFFDTTSLLFSLIGTFIYLEFIELHFWGLDHELKTYIMSRAVEESPDLLFLTNEEKEEEKEDKDDPEDKDDKEIHKSNEMGDLKN